MARYSVDYDGDLSTTDDRVSFGSFDAATGAISDQGFGSYSIQDNRRGGGGNLGSFGSDEAGRRAGFGALNDARSVGGFGLLGGLLGSRPFGIIGADGARTGVLADMVNGGGPGAAGNAFQGGILSNILNALGVLPAGFRSRQEEDQPQPQMTQADVLAQMAAPPATASAPVSAPVTPAPVAPMYSPRGRPAPLSASPDYLSPGMTPPGAMTSAPQGMTMFGGQGPADRPYVDMSQPEFGTVRPGVSRAGGRIPPMMGFTPNVNTLSTPRPAGMGLGPDAGRAAQVRAFIEMQRRAAGRPLGMGGLLGR